MPIYEYRCQSCGDVTEALQKLSDPPLETCEECGGDLKKLVSAPAFQFKGSGWYVTDYADRKPAGGGDEGKGEADASGKTSGGDTDGAAATKSSDGASSSGSSSDKGSDGKAAKGGTDTKAAAG